MKSRALLLLLFLCLAMSLAMAGVGQAAEAEECVDCHVLASSKSRLRIDVESFRQSVHGQSMACTDCHRQVEMKEHACRPGSGAVDCSDCHEQKNAHGQGGLNDNRPACQQCHGAHYIFAKHDPRSSLNPDNLPKTCALCHPGQSGQEDYLSWLPSLKIATHAKADFSNQDFNADNCLGCHQGRAAHGEAGKLNQQGCPRCHMRADGTGRLLGAFHPQTDQDHQPGAFVAAIIYLAAVAALLIGGMAFFIGKLSGGKKR